MPTPLLIIVANSKHALLGAPTKHNPSLRRNDEEM